MHHIQSHILKALSLTKKASYSKLKPRAIPGNQFSYHLKLLLIDELIRKNSTNSDSSYSLSSKGKQYADRVTLETFKERIQPKIVTLIVLEQGGKYLFYERNKSPFIGHIGFPYGKIHLEEHIQEAVDRELLEKTGLRASLRHRGDVYITVHDETELISHMLCHVFNGKYSDEKNLLPPSCFWASLSGIPKQKLIPGVLQIEKLLKKKQQGLFFAEFLLNI